MTQAVHTSTCPFYNLTASNGTEADSACATGNVELASLPKLLSGSVIFLSVLPFLCFHFRFLPIGTTLAVLLGTAFMVFANVLPQAQLYAVIGQQQYLSAIYILLGIAILAKFFHREEILTKILRRTLKANLTLENYLWRVCLISLCMAAVFSSDVCCAVLTPVLVKFWQAQDRQQIEIETLILGVATTANIGSVITLFGSPQMALLSSVTSYPEHHAGTLDLRRTLVFLAPAALLAFIINLGFLLCHFRIRSNIIHKAKLISEASFSDQEMAGLSRSGGSGDLTKLNGDLKTNNGLLRYSGGDDIALEVDTDSLQDDRLGVPCHLETILEDEILEITSSRSTSMINEDTACTPEHVYDEAAEHQSTPNSSDEEEDEDMRNTVHAQSSCDTRVQERNLLTTDVQYRPNALQSEELSCRQTGNNEPSPSDVLDVYGYCVHDSSGIYRSTSAFSSVDFLRTTDRLVRVQPACSDSSLFQAFLLFMVVVIFALNLASTPEVTFDIGLVPLGAALLVLTADAIFNRQCAVAMIQQCDWSIIVKFMGTFAFASGFNSTGVPRWLLLQCGLQTTTQQLSVQHMATVGAITVLGSNLFTPYLFLLLMLELLRPCCDQLHLVLVLAWCAGVGGNLTLFGSVSNVLTAQSARQSAEFRLSHWIHFRFAFISTIVNLVVGMAVIYAFLAIGARLF